MTKGHENPSDGIPESPQFREYLDTLWHKLPTYARRAASVKEGAEGSVGWTTQVGRYWWDAREAAGIDRNVMGDIISEEVNRIRFFEMGLWEPKEMTDMPPKYSNAIGQSSLEEFHAKFNFPRPEPQK